MRRSVGRPGDLRRDTLLRTRAVPTPPSASPTISASRGADVLPRWSTASPGWPSPGCRRSACCAGEPPDNRGYTPSVMHRRWLRPSNGSGPRLTGSITGIITVLVDGDDMDEPIADAARGILDGHILLDRSWPPRGHYPAVDVLRSISRLFTEITTREHRAAALKVRECMADLRRTSPTSSSSAVYKPGTSPRIDRAIRASAGDQRLPAADGQRRDVRSPRPCKSLTGPRRSLDRLSESSSSMKRFHSSYEVFHRHPAAGSPPGGNGTPR